MERVRLRGSRKTWFRIRPGVWAEMLEREMLRVRMFRQLAQEAMATQGEETRSFRFPASGARRVEFDRLAHARRLLRRGSAG